MEYADLPVIDADNTVEILPLIVCESPNSLLHMTPSKLAPNLPTVASPVTFKNYHSLVYHLK